MVSRYMLGKIINEELHTKEYEREKREKWPEYVKRNSLRVRLAKYGLTTDAFDAMYEGQNGLCAACMRPLPKEKACVDHCHETGVVRGLVHGNCNTAIGLIYEDVEVLANLISYLTRNRESGDE